MNIRGGDTITRSFDDYKVKISDAADYHNRPILRSSAAWILNFLYYCLRQSKKFGHCQQRSNYGASCAKDRRVSPSKKSCTIVAESDGLLTTSPTACVGGRSKTYTKRRYLIGRFGTTYG
uniref:Uncharacterized protein n=1 Tax=Romanomermis culicivorax TaxID=13658 RepID=A0A915KVN5_ROMCU